MNEFDLIDILTLKPGSRLDVELGVGDDAAIVTPPESSRLAMATDTLVAGIHFFSDAPAYDIAYRSLAVNLSDMAAMGATPAWVTMSLTAPKKTSVKWFREFSNGFRSLLQKHDLQLVGGDLCHGSLSITIQVIGFLPKNIALLRSGAKVGDKIFVSGDIGGAALALKMLSGQMEVSENYKQILYNRFYYPEPQVELGKFLLGYASSAIDISDGLAADLGHILKKSGVGAEVYTNKLPICKGLKAELGTNEACLLAISGGDDYQVCFTVPKELSSEMVRSDPPCPVVEIGEITSSNMLKFIDIDGNILDISSAGYHHFN